jgi:hypothetical protein
LYTREGAGITSCPCFFSVVSKHGLGKAKYH